MRRHQLMRGCPYVAVRDGIVPKFFTKRDEDGTMRLGGSEYSSNGHWEWFATGTPLVFIDDIGEDEYHEGTGTNRLVFLFGDGHECHVLAAEDTELPIITMEQWMNRCDALLENIAHESEKLNLAERQRIQPTRGR